MEHLIYPVHIKNAQSTELNEQQKMDLWHEIDNKTWMQSKSFTHWNTVTGLHISLISIQEILPELINSPQKKRSSKICLQKQRRNQRVRISNKNDAMQTEISFH